MASCFSNCEHNCAGDEPGEYDVRDGHHDERLVNYAATAADEPDHRDLSAPSMSVAPSLPATARAVGCATVARPSAAYGSGSERSPGGPRPRCHGLCPTLGGGENQLF